MSEIEFICLHGMMVKTWQACGTILKSNSKNTAKTQYGNIISDHNSSVYRYATYIYEYLSHI